MSGLEVPHRSTYIRILTTASSCSQESSPCAAATTLLWLVSTLDFASMNATAGQTGQPVVGPPMTAEEATAIVAAAH